MNRRQALPIIGKAIAAASAVIATVPAKAKPRAYVVHMVGRNSDPDGERVFITMAQKLGYTVERLS